MAREGVNYPGWFNQAACSIRCQLARLWSAVGSKVAKVNTVQPDGDGKLNIVSDTANLTVTDDPSNNAIRLDLGAGLQAPPVTSVNGYSGAVVLDTNVITGTMDVYNGSSIASATSNIKVVMDANAAGAKAGDDALRAGITAEATARGNADSTLQTNINSSNSRISILETADTQNVKLTGAQTITGVKEVPTETTGTYSSQIANSQKVKNELDNYAPMVRTTGNQNVSGVKTFTSYLSRYDTTVSSVGTVTKMSNLDYSWTGTAIRDSIPFKLIDANNHECFRLQYRRQGKKHNLYAVFTLTDGNEQSIVLATFTEP